MLQRSSHHGRSPSRNRHVPVQHAADGWWNGRGHKKATLAQPNLHWVPLLARRHEAEDACVRYSRPSHLLLELCAGPDSWLRAVLLGSHRQAWQLCVLLEGGRKGCGDGATP